MIPNPDSPKMYTPEQVADILQLSKDSVYNFIRSGEIIAKKFGNVYRIPATSLSFVFTGLDYDLYQAEQEDLKELKKVQEAISQVRLES
jgi:excisionase family DNA binding protein